MKFIKHYLRRLAYLLSSLLIKKRSFRSYYINFDSDYISRKVDSYFTTVDERRIPVYKDYRTSVKNWSLAFEGVEIFAHLVNNNLVSHSENQYFKQAIGMRTLECHPKEIEDCVKVIIKREELNNLFILESLDQQCLPTIAPSDRQLQNSVKNALAGHQNMLFNLKHLGVFSPKSGLKLLEIGFASGGHSLFAFEQLGFSCTGIDNGYGGFDDEYLLPNYIKNKMSSNVNLCYGDITEKNMFDDESFDVIYSASVLEHIQNIPAAFKEMHRLLKPGGVMIHSYNPFFCPNGGHALGILDSPWAHVRMNQEDYLRYMDELRPFEANRSKEWILKALNPLPTHMMQLFLSQSEFKLRYWLENPASSVLLRDQNAEIMLDCFQQYPGITLNDLTAEMIFFVAIK